MTIHLPQSTSLPELRRVMELMQRQQGATVEQGRLVTNTPISGGGSGGGSGSSGANGTNGVDGIANLDLIVTSLTETEDIVTEGVGGVVSDENGYAVTETHYEWDIVTDELGAILTAE